MNKQLIKLSLAIIGFSFFVWMPIFWYVYNKTIWYDISDCMIDYVKRDYPYGALYQIKWESNTHISGRWLESANMKKVADIDGCNYLWKADIVSSMYNMPYCAWTVIFENKFLQ
jgi:hypothetical protein